MFAKANHEFIKTHLEVWNFKMRIFSFHNSGLWLKHNL